MHQNLPYWAQKCKKIPPPQTPLLGTSFLALAMIRGYARDGESIGKLELELRICRCFDRLFAGHVTWQTQHRTVRYCGVWPGQQGHRACSIVVLSSAWSINWRVKQRVNVRCSWRETILWERRSWRGDGAWTSSSQRKTLCSTMYTSRRPLIIVTHLLTDTWRHSYLWSRITIRPPCCRADVKLTGEDLSRYWNKTKSF